ncbi:uncharacterized protein LOC107154701 isoform X1 [Marmota marmota marmota]|uniref:uncharacterized protein LOC107154701 isoform X1 n=1 Tax=Marmota marmota marmota TaxID=9994 RepID=UPI0020935F46|nr:uncharacterized protein LOC107154701 isoform X1 [Marmota marmota marmota]
MDVSGQETDWRSAAFRQKLVSQMTNTFPSWPGSLSIFEIFGYHVVHLLLGIHGSPPTGHLADSPHLQGQKLDRDYPRPMASRNFHRFRPQGNSHLQCPGLYSYASLVPTP